MATAPTGKRTMGRAQVPGAAFKFLENKKEIFYLSQGTTFYCCCHYLVSDVCFSLLCTDHQVKKKKTENFMKIILKWWNIISVCMIIGFELCQKNEILTEQALFDSVSMIHDYVLKW